MNADLTTLLVAIHALATFFMTGLIWFVQVVHYPLMAKVGADGYRAYQEAHESRTSLVVIPPMLVEVAAAVALFWTNVDVALLVAGAAMLAVVWGSTFLLQVPCHAKLQSGLQPAVVKRLVATNWIRTLGWTVRSGIAFALLLGT